MKKIKFTIAAICIAVFSGSTDSTKPVSDHCDGKKFFNPGVPDMGVRSIGGFLKWFSIERAEWPEAVENTPDLHLYEDLKSKVAITFVNHSTVLIQLPGVNILTDPIWSERAGPVNWIGPRRVRKPGIDFDKLPVIHIVLISHNHYDHLDINTIEKLEKKFSPVIIVPLDGKPLLDSIGVRHVQELDWWEEIIFNNETSIIFTPAQHWSGRGFFDRFETLWGGYLIRYKNHLIYFGGDAGYSKFYSDICKRYGKIDIAFLPVGIYEPRSLMHLWHMNPADSVKAHMDLKSGLSIGIHFNTFRLGAESIDQPITDLREALSASKIPENDFIVLKEGQTKFYNFKDF